MRRTGRKLMALLLIFTLAISMMSVSAFAEDADEIAESSDYELIDEIEEVELSDSGLAKDAEEIAESNDYELIDKDELVDEIESIEMAVSAAAEDAEEIAESTDYEPIDEYDSTDDYEPIDEYDSTDEIEWTELKNSGTLSSGNYYLSEDLNIRSFIYIREGSEVTIDLNGHAIERTDLTSADELGSVIFNYGTLTILDSSGNNSGSIAGGYGWYGGGVFNYGTLVLNGGTISGNKVCYLGAGVYNNIGGVFTMNDGAIIGNECYDGTLGGGVCNYGRFDMYGGKISANHAEYGGGLTNLGDFTLFGGIITGNTSVYYGGGVVDAGTMTMYSGEISDNYAANHGGGGVAIVDGILHMNGGKIINNSTGALGGGIYYYGKSYLYLSGAPVVSGNRAETDGDNLLLIEDPDYPSVSYIYFESELTEGASVGVTTLIAPTNGNPVQISAAENSTAYYISSAKYIVSDAGYSVRSNTEGGYLELYVSGDNQQSGGNGQQSSGNGQQSGSDNQQSGETGSASGTEGTESSTTSVETADNMTPYLYLVVVLIAGAAAVTVSVRRRTVRK